MKKIRYIPILLLMIIGLTACGQAGQSDTTQTENSEIGSAEDTVDFVGGAECKPDFVMGTDDQPDCPAYEVYTETGCYSLLPTNSLADGLDGWMLTYVEYGSSTKIPVCGKADCDHNNAGCNAYFDSKTYPNENLWYYNQKLYLFAVQNDYFAIKSVSKDGSERSTSCILYRTNVETETDEDGVVMSRTYYPEIAIHRGYAYFSTYYPGNKSSALYRVKLDSDDASEQLCVQEGNYPILYRLKGYGNHMFFQMGNFVDKAGLEVDINLYAWNLDTETVEGIAEDIVRNYTVGDNSIYYFDLDNLDSVMKYDLISGETEMLRDSNGQEALADTILFVKDSRLYYTTSNSQYVIGESGEQIETLKGDERVSPYAVDSN
jgi:hypothetical protein